MRVKVLPRAFHALQQNHPTQEFGQLFGNGEPQSGTLHICGLCPHRPAGMLEKLPPASPGAMPMPSSLTAKAMAVSGFNPVPRSTSAPGLEMERGDLTLVGKLKGVGQQVTQHLLKSLGIGTNGFRQDFLPHGSQTRSPAVQPCLCTNGGHHRSDFSGAPLQ